MNTGPKQRRVSNPRYKANIFSALTFAWTIETFKLGYTREIRERDLHAPLPEHRSDVLGDAMQAAWDREARRCALRSHCKPNLWKVIAKVFGTQFLLYGLVLAAMEFLIRLQQPLFLGLLLRYYSPVQENTNHTASATYLNRLFHYYDAAGPVSWGEAVFFCFGVVFCSAANILVQHPFLMGVMHLGMKLRVGMCSLIYRKALRVSVQAMSESSAGQVVNFMANDVNRFDTGPAFLHYLWIGPLEATFMTAYLYQELGVAAVYGVLTIVVFIPFQIYLGTKTAQYRRGTADSTDERARLMNEIILGIEVIKMYTWEEPFRTIIDLVRRKEIHFIRMASYIRGIILSFLMFTSRFGIFMSILAYVWLVERVTVEKVFVLTCYYNITKQTMTLYFPQALGQLAEMMVAVKRIRDYLLCEERAVSSNTKHVTIKVSPEENSNASVDGPTTSRTKPASILKTEAEPIIEIKKAATKWLRSRTDNDIRDITLEVAGGTLLAVIGSVGAGKTTLLHLLMGELPCLDGSLRVTGTVSYAGQEPWLFLGSVRQNILFGQPFNKARYMEVCKVCALERDLSLFPHGDRTIVGERGVALSGGQRARINLARAVYKQADIYLLDDPLSAVDAHVAKHIFDLCISTYLKKSTVVLVTHQIQFLKNVDNILVMDDGRLVADGTFAELKSRQLEILKMIEEKAKESTATEEVSPAGSPRSSGKHSSAVSLLQRRMSALLDGPEPQAEWQAVGRVKGSAYSEYFLAGGRWPLVALVSSLFLLAQFCASAGDFWISRWSKIEDELTGDGPTDNIIWSEQNLQRHHYVIIFAFITVGTMAAAIVRAIFFFTLCMRSSIKLHDHMFERISRSPMSFFHNNPSGRILNRFSKDMGAIDELLPQAMMDCTQIMLNMVGVVTVIILVDVTLLIPITAALIIFYIFRIIYIRTTGAVKRLEGITRSPVFGHLNATVMGVATIRSFGAERLLAAEFDAHQDLHSASWFLFISCSRAFGYFLDFICLLFIACVTFGCLMHKDAEGSNVGLAITQSISLTGVFQWGMRQSAEMENQMTSVERVLEYTKMPTEIQLTDGPELEPPAGWPSEGAIRFVDLSLRYEPNGNLILHNLNFSIAPGEKVGIVGRTGAGKSSLIQAMFRLAYLSGSILLDGEDITRLDLRALRHSISIIPQKPVLFSGSMRKNLDPFEEFPDQVLLEALEAVELTHDHAADVLGQQILEDGSNFSVGERQLVCLARAIVRRSRVLLLDEATANVDGRTDRLIQRAIRTHCRPCTILTVAHRLHTVIRSDKILVLDAGRLVEEGAPLELLRDRRGHLTAMVAETGPAMAAQLFTLALEVIHHY